MDKKDRTLTDLHDRIAEHADAISLLFQPGAKVTVVVRNEGYGDAGVVVSDDALPEVLAEIRARMEAAGEVDEWKERAVRAELEGGWNVDPKAYVPREELDAAIVTQDRMRTCDLCGTPRTLHPSGNFYECLPCHQQRREIWLALRAMLDQVDGDPRARQFFDDRLVERAKAAARKVSGL